MIVQRYFRKHQAMRRYKNIQEDRGVASVAVNVVEGADEGGDAAAEARGEADGEAAKETGDAEKATADGGGAEGLATEADKDEGAGHAGAADAREESLEEGATTSPSGRGAADPSAPSPATASAPAQAPETSNSTKGRRPVLATESKSGRTGAPAAAPSSQAAKAGGKGSGGMVETVAVKAPIKREGTKGRK